MKTSRLSIVSKSDWNIVKNKKKNLHLKGYEF